MHLEAWRAAVSHNNSTSILLTGTVITIQLPTYAATALLDITIQTKRAQVVIRCKTRGLKVTHRKGRRFTVHE
jgi:hypothetical protein